MNSEKVMVIDCSLKLVDPVRGVEEISEGGIVSFGPPVGLLGFAHLDSVKSAMTRIRIMKNIFFNDLFFENIN